MINHKATETIMSVSTMASGHAHRPIQVMQRGEQLVVDIHCHLNVAQADVELRNAIGKPPPPLPFTCAETDAVNARMFKAIGSRLNGVTERIADMDKLGVDVQAISPSPGQYFYFTEAALGRELAITVNNGIAEAVAKHPDRLVGMGTLPMQAPELAITEMRRCMNELDLRGIEISTNVQGKELSDPQFSKFFAAAEELGMLLFIHPSGFTEAQRLTQHYFNNVVGNPLDTTIAISHLIFGGVLARHPGLKLCVAHGGGYLPGYWGRMDHAFHAREDCRLHIDRAPSTFMRQLWLDTLVFDPAQLESLVRTHGADRLCMGSDYPFDMAEPDPVGIHQCLEASVKHKILGGNAAQLLGLVSNPGHQSP